jgi:hypothetical protein
VKVPDETLLVKENPVHEGPASLPLLPPQAAPEADIFLLQGVLKT